MIEGYETGKRPIRNQFVLNFRKSLGILLLSLRLLLLLLRTAATLETIESAVVDGIKGSKPPVKRRESMAEEISLSDVAFDVKSRVEEQTKGKNTIGWQNYEIAQQNVAKMLKMGFMSPSYSNTSLYVGW